MALAAAMGLRNPITGTARCWARATADHAAAAPPTMPKKSLRFISAPKEKERERREKAVAKAQAAFDKARRDHEAKASALDAERVAAEERYQHEESRWQKEKEKLEAALRRARE